MDKLNGIHAEKKRWKAGAPAGICADVAKGRPGTPRGEIVKLARANGVSVRSKARATREPQRGNAITREWSHRRGAQRTSFEAILAARIMRGKPRLDRLLAAFGSPHNLGRLFRTALACGANGLGFSERAQRSYRTQLRAHPQARSPT